MDQGEDLKRDVLEELRSSLNTSEIGVSVTDGVVTLTGYVNELPEKSEAERAARRVPGVRAVVNGIEIRVKQTDVDIARAALAALERDSHVPHDRIKIIVQDGYVTLEGEVDWKYQKIAAARVIRRLVGVRKVNNQIVKLGHGRKKKDKIRSSPTGDVAPPEGAPVKTPM